MASRGMSVLAGKMCSKSVWVGQRSRSCGRWLNWSCCNTLVEMSAKRCSKGLLAKAAVQLRQRIHFSKAAMGFMEKANDLVLRGAGRRKAHVSVSDA